MSIRSSPALDDRGAVLLESLRATLNELAAQRAPIAVPDLSHVVDQYIQDLRSRTKDWRKTEVRLRRMMLTCPTAAPADIRRFRASLLNGGTGKETANKYVDALRRCLNWATKAKIIRGHDVGDLEPLEISDAERRKRRRALTEGEVLRLLGVSEAEDSGREFPQTPLYRTIIETGLRWGEAVKLGLEDLRNDAVLVRAKNTKNGKARWFPLSHVPGLIAELRINLPFRSPRGKPLRQQSNNGLRTLYRMLTKAGIPRHDPDGRSIDVHALRWTAATRMLRRGVPMETVAALLGHSDVEMLRRGTYADIGIEDHREVLKKAWSTA